MKKWQNFSAFSKAKSATESIIVECSAILEELLTEDVDQEIAISKLKTCIDKVNFLTGVIQTLGYTEFSAVTMEISDYISACTSESKAYSHEQRQEALRLTYLILADLPATLEGIASGQIKEWFEYCHLVNKIRKARNLSLIFGITTLSIDEAANYAILFKSISSEMSLRVQEQIEKYKKGFSAYNSNKNNNELSEILTSIFTSLSILHRDFRIGTLWELCLALVEILPKEGSDISNNSTFKILTSFEALLVQLKDEGEYSLNKNISENLLSDILDIISSTEISTSRIQAIKLWFNLKLALTKEFRKANQNLLVGFSRKSAYVKASKFLTEEINKLYDSINSEAELNALSEEQLAKYISSLSKVSNSFSTLSMEKQAEVIESCISLFQCNTNNFSAPKSLAKTAQSLYQAEVALLTKTQEIERSIFSSITGNSNSDVLAGAKLSLVAATLKAMDNVILHLDNYVESIGDLGHLNNTIVPLEEIKACLSAIPLKRACEFINGALSYVKCIISHKAHYQTIIDNSLRDLAHLLLNTRSYLEQLNNDRSANYHWILDPNDKSLENLNIEISKLNSAATSAPADILALDTTLEISETNTIASISEQSAINIQEQDSTIDDEITEATTGTIIGVDDYPLTASSEDEDDIKAIFTEEASEILTFQEEYFTTLSSNLNDNATQVDLRRSFHTLKGSGRMVGATAIGELAWRAEYLLNNVINGRLPFTEEMLGKLQITHAAVPAMLADFNANRQIAFEINSVATLCADLDKFSQPNHEAITVFPATSENINEPDKSSELLSYSEFTGTISAIQAIPEHVSEIGAASTTPAYEFTAKLEQNLNIEAGEAEVITEISSSTFSELTATVDIISAQISNELLETTPFTPEDITESPNAFSNQSFGEANQAADIYEASLATSAELTLVEDMYSEEQSSASDSILSLVSALEPELLDTNKVESANEAENLAWHAQYPETVISSFPEFSAITENESFSFHSTTDIASENIPTLLSTSFENSFAEVDVTTSQNNHEETLFTLPPDALGVQSAQDENLNITDILSVKDIQIQNYEFPVLNGEIIEYFSTEEQTLTSDALNEHETIEATTINESIDEDQQAVLEFINIFSNEVDRQITKIQSYLSNQHGLDDNGYSITTTSFLIPVHTLSGSSRIAGFTEFSRLINTLERTLETHPYRAISSSMTSTLLHTCNIFSQINTSARQSLALKLPDSVQTLLDQLQALLAIVEEEFNFTTFDTDSAFTLHATETEAELATLELSPTLTSENNTHELYVDAFVNSITTDVEVLSTFTPTSVSDETAIEAVDIVEVEAEVVAPELAATPGATPDEESEEKLVLAGFLGEANSIVALLQLKFSDFSQSPSEKHNHRVMQQKLGLLQDAATLVNAQAIVEVCHVLALTYQHCSRDEFKLTATLLNALEQGHRYLAQSLHNLATQKPNVDATSIVQNLQALLQAGLAANANEIVCESDDQVEETLLAIFLEEAKEILTDLDSRIVDWQQMPTDSTITNDLMRSLHTLKGSAALVGETEISEHSHQFESFIIAATRTQTFFDANFFNKVDEKLHKLQALYASYRTSEDGKIVRITSVEPASPISFSAYKTETSTADTTAVTPTTTTATDTATFSSNSNQVATAEPAQEAVAQDSPIHTAQVVYIRPDAVSVIQPNKSNEQTADQNNESITTVDEQVRVSSNLLRSLLNDADEINIARNRVTQNLDDCKNMLTEVDETLKRLRSYVSKFELQAKLNRASSHSVLANSAIGKSEQNKDFDTLEMDRYTELQQISLSLLEDYEDLSELRTNLFGKLRSVDSILTQQKRVTNRLQDGLISSQMVPFAGIVPRLRRLTRQVSMDLGKQVNIKFSNPDGKIDRSILQALLSPLEHMIRNAIDHGIELPTDRLQKGKPEQGTILIKLYRQGAGIHLDLSDDGKGINLDSVKRKAVEMRLIPAGTYISDQDAYKLIFASGFTTASALSKISGRGVGLDVVHNEITNIGGDIDVQSKMNEGTTFKFRLPLTASLNRALLFTLNGSQFVMLLNTIDGIMLETVANLRRYAAQNEVTKLRYSKQSYDLAYFGKLLDGTDKGKYDEGSNTAPVLLISGSHRRMALQVDTIMGSHELVVKPLGLQFASVTGVSGVVILGDGNVVPVIDPIALVDEFTLHNYESITKQAPTPTQATVTADSHMKTVMVVDDSITVRKVTSTILKRHGYQVLTAKNGIEAIEVLHDTLPDVMLLDIEMPKMDGFEVASYIRRQTGALKQLPIIMITSRIGDKHRNRALEIGVNEYMCKPFQEDKLIETIASLTTSAHLQQITG